jgi:uncharacterized membrane protein YbhN (UPF0104 family)
MIWKKGLTWVGRIISVVAIFYFLVTLAKQFENFPSVPLTPGLFGWFFICIFLFLLNNFIVGFGWKFVLACLGEQADIGKIVSIFLISQFAKYIPGNFSHHIGRVALAKTAGLNVGRVIVSLVIDLLALLFAGACFSLVALFVIPETVANYLPYAEFLIQYRWGILVLALFGVSLAGFLALGELGAGSETKGILSKVNMRTLPLLISFLLKLIVFVIDGFNIQIISRFILSDFSIPYFLGTSFFSIAFLVGFLMPGAPAGMGVRETMFLALFSSFQGLEVASLLIVLLRLANVMGDGSSFLLGLILQRNLDKNSK